MIKVIRTTKQLWVSMAGIKSYNVLYRYDIQRKGRARRNKFHHHDNILKYIHAIHKISFALVSINDVV